MHIYVTYLVNQTWKNNKGEVEMQGEDFMVMKVLAMYQMVQDKEDTISLDWAIETIVKTTGQFNSKDVSPHLEAYKVEMLMRDIQ